MPNPSTSSGIIQVNPTGNVIIDALTEGGERWANPVITYSFPDYGSYWSTDPRTGYGPSSDKSQEPWNSFEPISSSDRGYFIEALHRWENVANVRFVQVQETRDNVGDLRIAYTHKNDPAQAWTYGPSSAAKSGDIWVEINGTSANEVWEPGTYSFFTLLHEVGHTLGLSHPFENPLFPVALDSNSETIMSYSAIAGDHNSDFSFDPTTPMPLDILAIQYLYGANKSFHNSNDNYSFSDSKTYHETIWDGGGADDLIAYTGTKNSTLDLREGMGSYIGNAVYAMTASTQERVPNIWIAYDTVIENANGGSGSDVLIGNDIANYLNGDNGNDELFGGAGNDYFDWDGSLRRGNDIMHGETGDDVYVLDSSSDTVVEFSGQGTDTIWTDFSYSLLDAPFVENLYLFGDQSINASGNNQSNSIRGNDKNNILSGFSGDDYIDGGKGDDSLFGDAGNDTLLAGYGFDSLNGGTGSDIFGFYAAGHFRVEDFKPSQDLLFFDSNIGFHNLNELARSITNISQTNNHLTVEFGSALSVDLVGVHLNQLTADMIVFSI